MIKFLCKLLLAIILDLAIVMGVVAFYLQTHLTREQKNERIREIYSKVAASTGESDQMRPLRIVESPTVNAYANEREVVIFTGLSDYAESDDEIALVLGHEIAHITLGHVSIKDPLEPLQISVLEGQADKMGAVYMMKAGYDICSGRKLMKRWEKGGDYLGGDHPSYSYRYMQLNINCD